MLGTFTASTTFTYRMPAGICRASKNSEGGSSLANRAVFFYSGSSAAQDIERCPSPSCMHTDVLQGQSSGYR